MPRNPWLRAYRIAWSLSLEASSVVALRTLKLAAGHRTAEAEARRMVSEKIEAALALPALAFSGKLGVTAPSVAAKTLAHYQRKVRANRRRLTEE